MHVAYTRVRVVQHRCGKCGHVGEGGIEVFKCPVLCGARSSAGGGRGRGQLSGRAGKFYHLACATVKDEKEQASVAQHAHQPQLVHSPSSPAALAPCGLHTCRTCGKEATRENALRCVLCPTAYHAGGKCAPAKLTSVSRKYFRCAEHADLVCATAGAAWARRGVVLGS